MANANGTNGNGKSIINAKNIAKLASVAVIYFAYTHGISLLWIAGLIIAGGILGVTWFSGNHSNGVR